MLAGVSHDLRTPLTRMQLQLEMLEDVPEAQYLQADVAEMEHMVEGYLAFARGEGREMPAPTDLAGLLRDVVAQMTRQERKRVVEGKGGAVRIDLGGRRVPKRKKRT